MDNMNNDINDEIISDYLYYQIKLEERYEDRFAKLDEFLKDNNINYLNIKNIKVENRDDNPF